MKALQELTRKEITQRIRGLRIGGLFTVHSKGQRTMALRQGKLLHDSGLIKFKITTIPRDDGGFTVCAVPE